MPKVQSAIVAHFAVLANKLRAASFLYEKIKKTHVETNAVKGDIRTHGVPPSSPSGQGLGSTARLPCFAPWHSSLLGQSETSSFIYALSALILQNPSFVTDFFRNFALSARRYSVSEEKTSKLVLFFSRLFVTLQPTTGTQVSHLRQPRVRHPRTSAKR